MRRGLTIPAVVATAVLLAACGGDGQDEVAMEQQALEEDSTAGGELPPHLVTQLMDRYPVLREEPAPEPVPSSGASTAGIPTQHQRPATGQATFYADHFEGDRTASGIPFRQNQMVAAHRSFPFGTLLRVTHVGNDRSVNVRVVDRGPFSGGSERPIIDLSRRAATELGFIDAGRAAVRVEVLEWGDGIPQAS